MKAIVVKYFGPTNCRGSRYIATAEGGHRVSLSANDALSAQGNKDAAAIALCRKLGWVRHGLVSGGLPNGDEVYCFDAEANRVPIAAEPTTHVR